MARPLVRGREGTPFALSRTSENLKKLPMRTPYVIRYVRDIDGSSVLPKTVPRILRETSLALVLLVLFM